MADEILTPCSVARSRHWFRQVTAPYNVACGSGIVTVNSPSGSTLQCDTWLWDDMPLNSPKRPPYWNSTSGFHFHTSPQSQSQSAKFYPNRTTLSRKKWRHVIFKMADLSHLGLYGSNNGFFEKPMYEFLWVVNRHHSSKLLSFWENRVFCIWRPDRRTNRWTAPMH